MPKRKPPLATEPAQAGRRLDLNDEERRLFEREFAGVVPLRKGGDRVLPEFPSEVSPPVHAPSPQASHEGDPLVVDHSDGSITGASYGVSRETLRALARGEPRAESTCDLHGLVAEAARRRIQQFIDESSRAGRRSVLLISGRGRHSGGEGPVLRDVAVEVLCSRTTRTHVLAFSAAGPTRGGDGALAILLRRPSKA